MRKTAGETVLGSVCNFQKGVRCKPGTHRLRIGGGRAGLLGLFKWDQNFWKMGPATWQWDPMWERGPISSDGTRRGRAGAWPPCSWLGMADGTSAWYCRRCRAGRPYAHYRNEEPRPSLRHGVLADG